MHIKIDWSDGVYSFRTADEPSKDSIEVPEMLVKCWNTVLDAFENIQKQLCKLDNEIYDREEPNGND